MRILSGLQTYFISVSYLLKCNSKIIKNPIYIYTIQRVYKISLPEMHTSVKNYKI